MRIEKTDMVDCDEAITTIVEAESLETLGKAEIEDCRNDDRFEPCYGYDKEFRVKIEDDRMWITWSPGDGGCYTVMEYRVL
jgi:hypothetical protein